MTRRLYRSREDRWVAGVAAGMAGYTGLPVALIRFIWFLLLLPGGLPGIVPYIICWILIPRAPVASSSYWD